MTADNLPGHGRLLGNVYSYLGGKLEPILARAVRGMPLGMGFLVMCRQLSTQGSVVFIFESMDSR